MTKLSERKKAFFDGEKGESLFEKPILQIYKENELPELFKKVDGLDDHRLLSIVTALLAENRIDKLNFAFFPKYNLLYEDSNFTFSLKIKLIESLNVIPPLFCHAANCLRQIRNSFAHDLEFVHFEDLRKDSKTKKVLNKLTAYASQAYYFDKEDDKSLYDYFKNLSFYCIGGLDAYTSNIVLLRETISDTSFIESLYERVKKEEKQLIDAIAKLPPNNYAIVGDKLIINHGDGESTIHLLKKGK